MPRRIDMTLRLAPIVAPSLHGGRAPTEQDKAELAQLLLDAYRGTIDQEEETIEQAIEELDRTYGGEYGPFMAAESRVVERDGRLVSATLLTRWQDRPFVAYAITHPQWQRRGLARSSMLSAMHAVQSGGDELLSLVVTLKNEPAYALYQSLGFRSGR
jgi:ribosomal protein S18 acetylase RimI-like enzyme